MFRYSFVRVSEPGLGRPIRWLLRQLHPEAQGPRSVTSHAEHRDLVSTRSEVQPQCYTTSLLPYPGKSVWRLSDHSHNLLPHFLEICYSTLIQSSHDTQNAVQDPENPNFMNAISRKLTLSLRAFWRDRSGIKHSYWETITSGNAIVGLYFYRNKLEFVVSRNLSKICA